MLLKFATNPNSSSCHLIQSWGTANFARKLLYSKTYFTWEPILFENIWVTAILLENLFCSKNSTSFPFHIYLSADRHWKSKRTTICLHSCQTVSVLSLNLYFVPTSLQLKTPKTRPRSYDHPSIRKGKRRGYTVVVNGDTLCKIIAN